MSWSSQLTATQAATYTLPLIFDKSVNTTPYAASWIPATETDPMYVIIKNNTSRFVTSACYLPQCSATASTLNSSICKGKSTTLSVTTGTSYAWSNGATTASLIVSPTATTTYIASVTNGSGCVATSAVTVTVNALPTISAGSTVSICKGKTASLTVTGGSTYLWSNSITTATQTITPTASTSFYVTGTNTNGCSGTSSVAVTVNTIPLAPTVISPVMYSITATATALTATGSNLLWYTLATGGTGISIAPIPSITTIGSTNHYVSQTVTNCESPRATIVVTVTAIIQTIALNAGWNLISTNLYPTDSSITTLFTGLQVQEIKTASSFWEKGQSAALNSLTTLQAGSGYLIKMNASGTLSVTGSPFIASYSLPLKKGWNMVGCPFQTTKLLSATFNSTNCSIIKNFDGFWIPNGTVNSLSNSVPGKGYFINY